MSTTRKFKRSMFRASLKGLYGISLGQALKNSGCKSQRKLEVECGYDVKLREDKSASNSNDRLENNDKGKLESKEEEGGQGGALEYLENLSEGNGKGDER